MSNFSLSPQCFQLYSIIILLLSEIFPIFLLGVFKVICCIWERVRLTESMLIILNLGSSWHKSKNEKEKDYFSDASFKNMYDT